MKILHRYVLKLLLRNMLLSLLTFSMLFWIFDFFDRIDNILPEGTDFLTVTTYFLYKLPITVSYMLPVAMLVSCLLTIGLLSRNSEMTAMRASGVRVLWIAKPVFAVGLITTFGTILLNETLVPYSQRRVREIYNIDIMQKNVKGGFSQSDFWWRSGKEIISVDMFDSRTNTLLDFSSFLIDDKFEVHRRRDAAKVNWIDPHLGWSMSQVTEFEFSGDDPPKTTRFKALPLPISEKPKDFYAMRTDPFTMSYMQLREFIKEQAQYGLPTAQYEADLYAKLAFPFINFVIVLVVLPFALLPARSGSMAPSFLAGLTIGFSYFAVHSFSLALGRAELWPPMLGAWMANLVLLAMGLILNLGTESPN